MGFHPATPARRSAGNSARAYATADGWKTLQGSEVSGFGIQLSAFGRMLFLRSCRWSAQNICAEHGGSMSVSRRMTPVVIVLGGLLLGTAPLRADNLHKECKEEIRDAEKELSKAIKKHGADSRDAEIRQHELDEIRDHCRHSEHERREMLEKEHHELHEELEHEHGY